MVVATAARRPGGVFQEWRQVAGERRGVSPTVWENTVGLTPRCSPKSYSLLILQRHFVVPCIRNSNASEALLPPPLRGRVGVGGAVGDGMPPTPTPPRKPGGNQRHTLAPLA